ncbi:MAG: NAD(P)-dependent oxidoreductase [Chloroflexota bacterium]
MDFPERIETVAALDEVMTRPQPALIEFVQTLPNPLLILGAGGKMGPTLAVLARRAAQAAGHALDVIAVSRFSDAQSRDWLEAHSVQTISCDLFDRAALQSLPDAANLIYLVGLKFGTSSNQALTWAANTLIPANVAERYPQARIAALSTGNVYPLAPVTSGGWTEAAALTPLGEYANSAVARERIFEYESTQHGTPITLVRLSYALDLRYGVLLDIGQKVFTGRPVDLASGYVNCIWQGAANDLVIRSLALASSPPTALNLTGSEVISVRTTATRFGELMNRPVQFTGHETDTALLSDTRLLRSRLGSPALPLDTVIRWTADWIMHGGYVLNKPTHFEVRDGAF